MCQRLLGILRISIGFHHLFAHVPSYTYIILKVDLTQNCIQCNITLFSLAYILLR